MFEIALFVAVIVCAIVILLCKYVFKKAPEKGAEPVAIVDLDEEPWYLDYARSFFPVLLVVFMLRGFIVEPFRIPSGSMMPTLEIGDFILVNKFAYGVRLPILHKKIVNTDGPQRGDVMVFRFPGDNKTSYIKRVIALPGDEVRYSHKELVINGQISKLVADGQYNPFSINGRTQTLDAYTQFIDGSDNTEFSIVLDKRSSSANRVIALPEGKTFIVPEDKYFVMGDNRDNSQDGRFWGFVPDENVVGKAFFVWFHYNGNPGGGFKFSRIGEEI